MEAVEDEADVGAAHLVDDPRGLVERLDAATRLPQELEGERDAVLFSDLAQFVQHAHGLLDCVVPAPAFGEPARHDDDVWAAERGGRAAQILALREEARVASAVSK